MNSTSLILDPSTKESLGFPLHAKELCQKQDVGLHEGDLILITAPVPNYLRMADGFLFSLETDGNHEGYFVCSKGLLNSKKKDTDVGFVIRVADNLEVVHVLGSKKRSKRTKK
jgi:hypothetical protein